MYIHRLRVRFYHTDGMQVTHHANYFLWFEAARVEFFRSVGVSLVDLMNDGYVFPILHVECDYVHSSHYDDELEVRLRLMKMTRAQMVFRYEVVRPADDTLICTGLTKGTFTKTETFFLDNSADEAAIREQLRQAIRIAQRDGTAVAIGHARPSTAAAIRAMLGEVDEAGVELVFVSELLR